jgi:nucleoside-triphosphatase THEP1
MFEGSERIGYDLLDLETDERVALARKNVLPTGISTGPFTFLPAAIAFGELALASAAARKTHVIALDEIGPLELAGKGWSPALSALLLSPPGVLLLVVRPDLIQRVLERWNLKPAHVWKPGEVTPGEAARQIIATLSYAMPQ